MTLPRPPSRRQASPVGQVCRAVSKPCWTASGTVSCLSRGTGLHFVSRDRDALGEGSEIVLATLWLNQRHRALGIRAYWRCGGGRKPEAANLVAA
eukprot:3653541-Prymnesium_polylepis.1